ncbi:M20 metallopeptidase family protein [Clostridium pasteurianum]|uniref:Amidohydrolase n=1 Tax=Clostridium pasteurianum BC1 TaxID=86416 RepID=R4KH26_CLOPA|nr:amidohydrolase [Clostridium pasteurianum]AGK98915.1 amidohydrolase [Clostridium pasteurianum BC1]
MLISDLAYEIESDIIDIRRTIHKNPELAIQEFKTAKLVAKKLKELGIEVTEKVGKTGVIGLLRGEAEGKTVALRADMDALPIQEKNNHEFKSVNKNIMHACGHDVHTAALLGAADILSKIRHLIRGNVKFIFQPSEESPLGGAHEMIEEGVMENPKVDAIFGLHVDPNLLAGDIGLRSGEFYATAGGFEIEVIGKSGHGALPHKATDAIIVASELVLSLQTIASSKINPLEPFVITIGTINGGNKANIVADKVTLTGTIRFFNKDIHDSVKGIIENVVKGITLAHGASYNFKFRIGDSPLINDENMINIAKKSAIEIVGDEKVKSVPKTLLGEDFVFYSQIVPSAFMSLGVGFLNKKKFSLHNANFDLDERALPIGAALLANTAINFLNRY